MLKAHSLLAASLISNTACIAMFSSDGSLRLPNLRG